MTQPSIKSQSKYSKRIHHQASSFEINAVLEMLVPAEQQRFQVCIVIGFLSITIINYHRFLHSSTTTQGITKK